MATQGTPNPFQLMAEMPTVQSLAQKKQALLAKRRESKIAAISEDIPDTPPNESPTDIYNRMYGKSTDDSSFGGNLIDGIQAGAMNLAGKGAELLGEGIETAGDITNYDPLREFGTQIQKEQQQWRQEGKWNEFTGYDDSSVQKMGQDFGEKFESGDYIGAAGTLLQPAAILAFGNSLPEMVAMANPWGLGTVMATNVNKNLNDLGPDATDEQRSISVGLSVVGTALDRLGDKVVLGAGEKTLKRLLTSMPVNTQKAVFDFYKKPLARIGISAAAIAPKAGFEGLTELGQTVLEGKASDVDKMNFDISPEERKAGIEALGIGTAAGGVPSAVKASKEITKGVLQGGVNAGTNLAEKGIDAGKKFATDKAYKVMPQEARDKIKAKYVEDSRIYNETKAANEKAVSSIGAAKTVEDLQNLKDPEVSRAIETILDKDNVIKESKAKINEATTVEGLNDIDTWTRGKVSQIKKANETKTDYTFEEIQDKLIESIDERYTPQDLTKNIEKIKNEAIAQYNLGTDKLLAAKEAVRAKDFVYQASKGLYDETKKAIDKVLPEDVRAEIVRQAKLGVDLAKTGVDLAAKEVKDLNKSAVRAVIDDIAKGKLNKAIYAFSETQLADLKKGFEGNAKATAILNKAIEIQTKSAKEFEILKKGKKKFLESVVDGAGKILTSDIATKIQGLAELTAEKLTDSDSLYKAKKLVKALEEERTKDPKAFPKEGQVRLRRARKLVNEATKNGERGLVNEAIFQIGKAYRQHKVTDKTKGAAKATSTRAQALYKLYLPKIKKMAEDVGNSDFVKNFNKYVDELDTKLEEAGAAKSGIKKAEVSETQQKAEKVVTKEEVAQGAEISIPDMATISGEDYDTLTEAVGGIEALAATLSETDLNALATNTELSTEAQFLRGLRDDAELSVQDQAVSTSPDKAIDGTMSKEEEAELDKLAKIVCKD